MGIQGIKTHAIIKDAAHRIIHFANCAGWLRLRGLSIVLLAANNLYRNGFKVNKVKACFGSIFKTGRDARKDKGKDNSKGKDRKVGKGPKK